MKGFLVFWVFFVYCGFEEFFEEGLMRVWSFIGVLEGFGVWGVEKIGTIC